MYTEPLNAAQIKHNFRILKDKYNLLNPDCLNCRIAIPANDLYYEIINETPTPTVTPTVTPTPTVTTTITPTVTPTLTPSSTEPVFLGQQNYFAILQENGSKIIVT
jgi:hypothetical protein